MNTKVNIKKNTIANYIGQAYIMAIGILITPFYLRYLGTEAYGLIGFFALLQIWFNMLDFGLSPSFGREIARLRNNKFEFEKLTSLLRTIELYFFGVSILVITLFIFFNEIMAVKWINVESLPLEIVSYCIIIMGVIIATRWFSTLYKSGINSMEDQVWLNIVNVILASFKFVGSLLLLMFITSDIKTFFEYQLVVYVCEALLFMYRFYFSSLKQEVSPLFEIDILAIKRIFPFAMGIAYSTIIWTFLRQFDKLLLSNILSLSDFAYLSIVILISGSITALATPVFLAIVPRLTLYLENGEKDRLLSLYTDMSVIVTWITFTSISILSVFTKEIIYILTGDIKAALWCEDIMPLYLVGSGIIVLGTFPYYLQNVFGNLKLYVTGSTIAFCILIPLTYFITKNYGVYGAACLWLVFSIVWFFVLTPFVHKKFAPSIHNAWLIKLVYTLILISVLSVGLNYFVNLDIYEAKFMLIIKILLISIIMFVLSGLLIPRIRNILLNQIRHFKGNK